MIVRRYLDPFTEINAIRRQINDAFGDLTTELATQSDWTPAIRLVDRGEDFVLTVLLAGVEANQLDIQVSREAVSIAGQRLAPETVEGTTGLYDDTRYGRFYRLVNLPDAVQNNSVAADFQGGVLTLTLPKVVEAQNKVVKVSLGGDTAAPTIAAADGAADQPAEA